MNLLLKATTLCAILTTSLMAAADILIADFEGSDYGAWKTEGSAFGTGPAHGKLVGQMNVEGFLGKGLVNSFNGGDGATGKLTSPEFKIERPWVNFLIGGGGFAGETCMNLLIDGKVVRTATGTNTKPGGSEDLQTAAWDVKELVGKSAVIEIVDQREGGWGHITVDHIVQSDKKAAANFVVLERSLKVDGTHLIVPVANGAKGMPIGIYEGDKLVQSFNVALPGEHDASWLAAYPLDHFGLQGKTIKLASVNGAKLPDAWKAAFERIKVGAASDALKADDYDQPYRDQFHPTTRHGWNNDPNGMVYHDGKYHLYYQYNPFGIAWGNMHWGHFESTDLVHWDEKPIALFQKTLTDMAFSGGGFVDKNDTAGLGKDTLFVAFTSTGRGECLAYSKDGGMTFTELPENPVVKHNGRDPQIIWYAPEMKWIMTVYSEDPCAETEATLPSDPKFKARSLAFYESKNLHEWTRTGAFTDSDRGAVYECPNLIELPVAGKANETRWILSGAQNRFFIGKFDGKTFTKDSGPHGSPRGAFYAAQLFSNVPDGRGIQIGWIRNPALTSRYPDRIVSQSFTLPQELLLKETSEGLRVLLQPVKEVENLRGEILATSIEGMKACEGKETEVLIEFAESGKHELIINGIDATFTGRSARIFTDRTFNEIYADGGLNYTANARTLANATSTESAIKSDGVKSLRAYRLKSIWKKN